MPQLSALDPSSLWASVMWGALASGIIIYGWKQKSVIPLAGGLIMAGLTYFCQSALVMSLGSVGVIAGMIWCKKQGYGN